jgi:hypothetical protein
MMELFRNEVEALHRFFEGWFNGTIAATDDNFARLENVLGRPFTLISPDGQISERAALIAGLQAAHGSRKDDRPPFRIWIENLTLRPLSDRHYLVSYEEWQEIKGQTTARLSTALFCRELAPANRLQWLHVHETWLP